MTPGTLNLTLWRGTTFGPVEITCKNSEDEIVVLTGWSVFAQVRFAPGKHLVFNLEPTIPVGTDGRIVFGFTDEQTDALPDGEYVWDLLLERPSGEILGPVLAGIFSVKTVVTRP